MITSAIAIGTLINVCNLKRWGNSFIKVSAFYVIPTDAYKFITHSTYQWYIISQLQNNIIRCHSSDVYLGISLILKWQLLSNVLYSLQWLK